MTPDRLARSDAPALLAFYNGLGPGSIRLFRPLGLRTSLDVCQQIVSENALLPAPRFDLVLREADGIVAWAFIKGLTTDRPDLGLAVMDRLQGQGLGTALMTRLLGCARERGLATVDLMVVQDNQRAIHLYEKYGFATYGEAFDANDQLPYFLMRARP
jgi:GNAT superfamily N-acetyltransferase